MSQKSLDFLDDTAINVAQRLLGCELERNIDGKSVRVKIVETEAYDQTDAASHSYRGKTPRSDVMFGPAGHLYVYFTYGMHYCCNIVVGAKNHGAAVLIRAVEPLEGEGVIEKRRGKSGIEATNGPAKLCQAMGIDKNLNGICLFKNCKHVNCQHVDKIRILTNPSLRTDEITQTTRIGITKAKDAPWRFYITGNPYVSKY